MEKPTAETALGEIVTIVHSVKATKAEHSYLEQCLLALAEAVMLQKGITPKTNNAVEGHLDA